MVGSHVLLAKWRATMIGRVGDVSRFEGATSLGLIVR